MLVVTGLNFKSYSLKKYSFLCFVTEAVYFCYKTCFDKRSTVNKWLQRKAECWGRSGRESDPRVRGDRGVTRVPESGFRSCCLFTLQRLDFSRWRFLLLSTSSLNLKTWLGFRLIGLNRVPKCWTQRAAAASQAWQPLVETQNMCLWLKEKKKKWKKDRREGGGWRWKVWGDVAARCVCRGQDEPPGVAARPSTQTAHLLYIHSWAPSSGEHLGKLNFSTMLVPRAELGFCPFRGERLVYPSAVLHGVPGSFQIVSLSWGQDSTPVFPHYNSSDQLFSLRLWIIFATSVRPVRGLPSDGNNHLSCKVKLIGDLRRSHPEKKDQWI